MKFTEALEKIRLDYSLRITRKDWPFKLYFCGASGYLVIKFRNQLTTYTISEFDFDYEWEIEK